MHFSEKPEIVAINWEGFEAHAEGTLYAANPYKADPFNRALWSKGWCDRQDGRLKPETAFDGYWIVDDALNDQPGEGFQVYFGCPFRAIGTKQGEHLQFSLALASVPKTDAVYGVKLARRHGRHSVTLIRKSGAEGSGKSRQRTAAIEYPTKALDQAKITWDEAVTVALEEQGDLDRSDAQGILEVQSILAAKLYQDKSEPAQAAGQILAQPIRQAA